MQIYRFDLEVSIPVSQFGSSFSIGPLTGPGANARVQIMHVPTGGLIGRHPTTVRQLFAVVAGSGWVTGGDDVRRELGPGYAAVWEPGEEHAAGSDEGLTAVCVEGTFEMWAMRITREIVVEEYSEAWPAWFAQICDVVWPAVSDVALRIDHVGSTSVPGLAAKPIIDMDIVVADERGVQPVIERLSGIGYRWRGELGVIGRHSFKSIGESPLPEHHLYLVVENNRAHLDHWLLRDLLRSDAEARERYAALKRQNAADSNGDMDRYVAKKAKLVAELLARARAQGGWPPVDYWDPEA
ncbi:hypothetical protein AYO38_04395 [bacterium SCGC AG-212-C10]|nr:hypothetical protein AYO38_04395 [bacterium SCGC AG-212-C10]